jgi:hypothetical protein
MSALNRMKSTPWERPERSAQQNHAVYSWAELQTPIPAHQDTHSVQQLDVCSHSLEADEADDPRQFFRPLLTQWRASEPQTQFYNTYGVALMLPGAPIRGRVAPQPGHLGTCRSLVSAASAGCPFAACWSQQTGWRPPWPLAAAILPAQSATVTISRTQGRLRRLRGPHSTVSRQPHLPCT